MFGLTLGDYHHGLQPGRRRFDQSVREAHRDGLEFRPRRDQRFGRREPFAATGYCEATCRSVRSGRRHRVVHGGGQWQRAFQLFAPVRSRERKEALHEPPSNPGGTSTRVPGMVWEIRDSRARPSEVLGPSACQNAIAARHKPVFLALAGHEFRGFALLGAVRFQRLAFAAVCSKLGVAWA